LLFAKRPRSSIETAFGKTFVEELVQMPVGTWRPLASAAGWQVVRLDSVTPGRPMPLNEISAQAFSDWKDERRRELGAAAIRDLGKGYVVRRTAP
jgi:hypothetical protein